ncbi:MAG: OmpA family protein [Proteobacteria bacterium]|nr:OmpA family protein [Pseudomonadota bacterium]
MVEKELEQPQQPEAIAEPVSALNVINTPTAPTTSAAVSEPVVVEKVEVKKEIPVVKVEIPTIYVKNVLFEFDKFNIQEDHKQQLLLTLDNLENKDKTKFLIAGHADERGSNAYNLALGERRAFEVKRFLISMGFLEENMRIVSYGEEKPADRGHNEGSWAKNRRTETLDLSKEP